ncbi:ABC-2 type transport system permease protein [Streptomyces sp. 2231.1]|uniref:ABC transporter permease n=1 Tax=Streptomyces sp. 2231.1 TaxID=1855347 RepID=UPI00089C2B79|nr:ABC transporter permease [Streptomyces sp. 2231.1]SEE35760.1 ABC-2 type transport system permease protein [Streptomyces sp. 2231.1]
MRTFLAGLRLQAALLRRSPGELHTLATVPLYTLILLAMTDDPTRPGIAANAVIAPMLMALWSLGLFTAGDLIDRDRYSGTLEPTVAAPAPLALVVGGRICAVTAAGLIAFVEAWAVGLCFGVHLTLHHPLALLTGILASCLATGCTATMIAAVLVLTRRGRPYQNSLSFPVYLLSGIVLPISALPHWLHPVSRLIYLSWSADLLRSAFRPDAPRQLPAQLLALVLLAAAGLGAATLLLRRVLDRVRVLGTLGHA